MLVGGLRNRRRHDHHWACDLHDLLDLGAVLLDAQELRLRVAVLLGNIFEDRVDRI
jgi:hypothetical protein